MIETRKKNVDSQQAVIQTESSSARWHIVQEIRSTPPVHDARDGVAKSAPSRADLLNLAASGKCSPPAEWWDEQTDPFAPNE